jgi:Flp pilus assembly protein TadD
MKRAMIAVLAAAACGVGLWQAVRIGRARTLAQHAMRTNDVSYADRAVGMVTNDPETHAARGAVLQRMGDYPGACRELERAIQLRPRDYFLWMLLGVSRDLNSDQEGAVRALQQAIILSPVYAKPHWMLGNLLLRTNDQAEAIRELRFAATSDETLLANVIDLAWGTYRHDPAQTVSAIQPQTENARMVLAIFLAAHNQGAPALEQFRSVKAPSTEAIHNLLEALLRANLFVEANEVWAKAHRRSSGVASLLNPGFEDEITVGEPGFDWQISESLAHVTLSADPSQFQSGTKSLRVDFRGESDPSMPAVSQLVLVKPRTNYRLTFQGLAKDYLSTGVPVLAIFDASDQKGTAVAESAGISVASAWREFSIEFATRDQTNAVRLQLLRQGCSSNPCAAFGTIWLDSFNLQESPNIRAVTPAK